MATTIKTTSAKPKAAKALPKFEAAEAGIGAKGKKRPAVDSGGSAPDLTVTGPQLRKADLVERVTASVDVPKQVAKTVIDAVLAELGKSLVAGEEMNLMPFGKIKITREKDAANGKVFMVKVRQARPEAKPKDKAGADAGASGD
jgi:hypothetical protein